MTPFQPQITDTQKDEIIVKMGATLRRRRLENDWSQEIAAQTLGIGLSTYRKMESGDDGVSVGFWVRVWHYFNAEGEVLHALARPLDLLDELDSALGVFSQKRRPARTRTL